MHIAVIGAGISGIAAARILQKNGHTAVVFEKAAEPGGVWAAAYPDVHLQNIASQYHLADLPWPFRPDTHPSGKQVNEYLRYAIGVYKLDVRTLHEVTALIETGKGWNVHCNTVNGFSTLSFDFIIIASGLYTQQKTRPSFEGEANFRGSIVTQEHIRDYAFFKGKKVVVAGFGKTSLDMCVFAQKHEAAGVMHVFRQPHWLLTEHIYGIHFTRLLFSRFGSVMMSSWVHPSAMERLLHTRFKFLVNGFWKLMNRVFRRQVLKFGRNRVEKERLHAIIPGNPLCNDLSSKTALAGNDYLRNVALGNIEAIKASVSSFTEDGVFLSNGRYTTCDIVVLCLGNESARFPYLPEEYRALMEKEPDGTQLYRHLVHPRIPNLAFCGFNHCFMHVPAAEAGMQWICAMLNGDFNLPSAEEMEHSMKSVHGWKKQHMGFDPARAYGVSTRYQQYLDMLLKDIGLSPYRKMPNVLAELFSRYKASDYRDITMDYFRKKKRHPGKSKLSSGDT